MGVAVKPRYLPSLGGVTLHQLHAVYIVARGKYEAAGPWRLEARLVSLVRSAHSTNRMTCCATYQCSVVGQVLGVRDASYKTREG